ncbi:hypothetical protein [Shewanella oncorhynchi]|uniref:hypothetical protein n=1 Tax=Shewanella oncorhynchi TaxID=2726434 RepID=UPI003D7AE5D6
MQIETLYDVMQWTRSIHQQLHAFAAHCALTNDSERSGLLLEYISAHEKKWHWLSDSSKIMAIAMHLTLIVGIIMKKPLFLLTP